MNYRIGQKNLITFVIKVWLLILTCQLTKGSFVTCVAPANFNGKENEKGENTTSDEFRKSNPEKDSSSEDVNRNSHPCKYFKISKRLICTGSIDYDYLKTVRDEEINDFIVESYEAEYLFKRKYWSPRELKTGEWYLKLPKVYQRLTGNIQLQDTGVKIDADMRILPNRDSKGFLIVGEAFSNKVIKVSWRLNGSLSMNFIKNRTTISIDIGVIGDGDWRLQSNLTFSSRDTENERDKWRANGIIKPHYTSENQFVYFTGTIWTKIRKEECQFLGDVKVQNGNLKTFVSGNVSPPQRKQITIPKSAFSNMTIKNILFKDSKFYNDLDKNSFEGLRRLKRISFTDSKLEIFPRLDELFQGFSELEEIYIEDCTVPQLKFGTMASLKQVQKFSFKGSGPLNFDDSSFLWLKNSRLTFLNLRNSHVKISLKANSILWSVGNTLKQLDISHSTIKGEGELNVILKNLTILTLAAEGLNLNKIPTNALSNVRKTLTYLSLRENDFRKSLGKHIFSTILNFPLMINLKELNLEECHINFIERGAFDNLPNLKFLHLSYNNIENLQDGWTYIRPKITQLGLTHNDFTPQSSMGQYDSGNTMNLSLFTDLESLDLSEGIFRDINVLVGSLGSGLRNLSLRNTRLEELPDNFFENLSGLEVLDLSYNRNMRAEGSVSFNLFKNLKKLMSLDLKHCRITTGAVYPSNFLGNQDSEEFMLENLEYLDLSVNNFKILDPKILKAFPNLKILNLSGNSITEWNTIMFSNEHLESVFLDENKIEKITVEMLSDIRRLKHVKLGHNPFICGSYVYEVLKMINATSNEPSQTEFNRKNLLKESELSNQGGDFVQNFFTNVNTKEDSKFLDWSENNYICYSWSQSKFMPFTQVNEDFQDSTQKKKEVIETALLWWTGIIIIVIVTSIALICWKFMDIHLITRAVRSAVALTFIGRNEKEPANFKYNVFVSYCDKDRTWVVENLLPRLESRNEEQAVCLHERDFQVGLSIIENILNSIESSRNIILVVSLAFLKSQWCQYEMQLAQFRLLEKGRHQLILIFLENIPAIKRPKTLRYLMMTKTYLEWPLNPKNQREVGTFWNRLMKSLEGMN